MCGHKQADGAGGVWDGGRIYHRVTDGVSMPVSSLICMGELITILYVPYAHHASCRLGIRL